MKRLHELFVALAMLLLPQAVSAQATLSIEPFDISAGETKEMVIDLTNPEDEITLVQFDLRLPNGLSLKLVGSEYDIDMCDRTTWRKHSLDANATDGIIRFLLASNSNTIIDGTEGAIIKITLVADANFKSGTVSIENILLVTPDEKEIKPQPYTLTLGMGPVSYDPFVYFIGSTDGWSNPDQKLALTDANGIYTGYVYIADPYGWGLEFKFQRRAGEWADDSQLNSNNMKDVTGDFKKDADNFKTSAGEGVYYVELDLVKSILKGTFVHTMSIIGGFNGWSDDVVMSWNAQQYCYEVTNPGITENGWKFRVNKDWAINLGGKSLNDLVANGANLVETGNVVRLYPTRKTSDHIYCTVETIVPQERAYLSVEPFDIKAEETKEMVIDLTNPEDEITLVQFDLCLPTGLSLKQVGGEYDIDMCDRTTWRRHSLDANATDGIIRFLLASSSNTVIDSTKGALIKMTLVADGSYQGGEIRLEKILLVTPDEKEIKPADVVYKPGENLGITSVVDIKQNSSPVYSISGQRLDAPKKGINIVSGRKMVVK